MSDSIHLSHEISNEVHVQNPNSENEHSSLNEALKLASQQMISISSFLKTSQSDECFDLSGGREKCI
jgi:hypothetical protein